MHFTPLLDGTPSIWDSNRVTWAIVTPSRKISVGQQRYGYHHSHRHPYHHYYHHYYQNHRHRVTGKAPWCGLLILSYHLSVPTIFSLLILNKILIKLEIKN